MSTLRDTADTSVVVGGVRRLGRAVVTGVPVALTWLRRTNSSVAVGLRADTRPAAPDTDDLAVLARGSRVVQALASIAAVPVEAWRYAETRRLFDALLAVDLPARVRLSGWALLVAVLTHIVILAILGVPVFALGWSTRGILGGAALVMLAQPQVLANAWRDHAARGDVSR